MFLSRLLLTKIECRLVILSWILLPVLVLCTGNPVLFGVEINNYLVLQPPYDRAYGYARGEQDLNSRTDYNHSEDTTTGKVYVKAVSESECPLFSPPFGGGGATAYSSLFPARVKCIHTSDYKITFYFNIKGNAGVDNGSLIDWLNPIPSNAAAKAKVTLGALVYDVDEDYKVILEKEREIYDRELAWIPSLFSSFEYFDEDVTISETIPLTQGHEYLLECHINAVVTTSAIGMAGAKAIAMFDSGTIHWGEFLIPVDGYMELQSIVLEDLFPVEQPELLAHWNFDEGSGSIASDSSGNRKDGTIYGATWTTGKINNALNFNGSNDWVDVPDDISPEHITLEAWIYPAGVYDVGDQGSPIITKETGRGTPPWSESFAWRLRITPHTHKLQLQCFTPTGEGGGSAVSETVLQMERWYHVAGTYDGTETRVYINGNLEGSYVAPISEPLVASTLPTGIGHLPNWSVQWFQGIIDEVRVYGRALTEEEIAEHAIPVAGYAKPGPQTGNSSDIVLIYCGFDVDSGEYRNWEEPNFTPYISYVDLDNKPYPDKWMFDTFLFLARASDNYRSFTWADSSTNPSDPSLKEDWEWLLDDRFFASKGPIDALHAEARSLKRKLNVFVMIPYPDPHAKKDFGDVDNDGIKEDFTNNDDRYKAVVWYIEDKFLTEWNARNYDDFLNLVGFYWMHEGVYKDVDYPDDKLLLKDVSEFIHSINYKFMWIPCQGDKAEQAKRRNWIKPWYSYGFDFAIIQPNYYQIEKYGRDIDDLRNTADFAKENCLGVEIEFDYKVASNLKLQEIFNHYLEVGKEKRYREKSVLAYYQGYTTVHMLALHPDEEIRELYENLFRFINHSGQLKPGGDADADGILDDLENATETDPFDDDTDNDGLLDGPGSGEDANANGVVDVGETDPRSADTDGDGIQDGTECGLVAPDGLDTDLTVFVPDADPNSTTDPTNPDTDGDGLLDGEEDLNGNGAVDPGETDPSAITGVMDLDPNVLNLESKGKWVTCYIELPQGYDATDIILPSVALNSTIPPEFSVYEFGDYNANGIIDLMVKFNRELLIGVLGSVEHGQDIMLTLTGQLSNGTRFEGLDTIRVIKPDHE